jgi:hypothetical protein
MQHCKNNVYFEGVGSQKRCNSILVTLFDEVLNFQEEYYLWVLSCLSHETGFEVMAPVSVHVSLIPFFQLKNIDGYNLEI